MSYQHKELAGGRWFNLSFLEQMANTGSEVERAILWREKNRQFSVNAIERALELLSLTIGDNKNRRRLRELARVYETLVDYFYCDNVYGSSDKLWRNYFMFFSYASRSKK